MSGMYDPAHPREIVREAIVAEGWTLPRWQLARASRGTRRRGC